MMNFNYILGKNVTNDNLKSIFTLSLENTFLKKNTGGQILILKSWLIEKCNKVSNYFIYLVSLMKIVYLWENILCTPRSFSKRKRTRKLFVNKNRKQNAFLSFLNPS